MKNNYIAENKGQFLSPSGSSSYARKFLTFTGTLPHGKTETLAPFRVTCKDFGWRWKARRQWKRCTNWRRRISANWRQILYESLTNGYLL